MLTCVITEAEEAGGKVPKVQRTLELAQVSETMRGGAVAPSIIASSPSQGDSWRKTS